LDSRHEQQERTRGDLARIVVLGYLFLLAFNITVPLLFYLRRSTTAGDVKELLLGISSVLAGLVGILGFIVGYYFKSEQQETKKVTH
jgi:hypothetical protein